MPATIPDTEASSAPPSQGPRYCDIVMKGGITSGVVYPRAVYEISREFTFRGIGGTSAGAIAAAATAAAEYGRRNGRDGFPQLDDLPRWLGAREPQSGESNLASLFQPVAGTRRLFHLAKAALGNAEGRVWRIVEAAVTHYRLPFLLGLLPGLLIALLALLPGHPLLRAAIVVAGVIAALAGATLAIGSRVRTDVQRRIPENFFGLCTGHAEGPVGGIPPLTDWLTGYFNELAGKPLAEGPLTFGDLWGTSDPAAERAVDLQMMTTNLTHGRPYGLPFKKQVFYFHPEEMRRLFPDVVVDWMVAHARPVEDPERSAPLVPLPEAADLPVVFATRLSLSFPLVISAIPLYAVDYSRRVAPEERRPERCWFSDGGITSNFPVHFFDAPLPSWPTFGINLRPFHPDFPYRPGDESKHVWMPERNLGGMLEWWTRFEDGDPLTGFLMAIANSALDWADNTQLSVPGHRDRVVNVSLRANEGGLNLDMPEQLIHDLSERGRHAGLRLVERFGPQTDGVKLSWENHRWVRFRSTMGLLQGMLEAICAVYRDPLPGDRSYAELVSRPLGERPRSYPWRTPAQQQFAEQACEELCRTVGAWQQEPKTFEYEAPRPEPELRTRPKL